MVIQNRGVKSIQQAARCSTDVYRSRPLQNRTKRPTKSVQGKPRPKEATKEEEEDKTDDFVCQMDNSSAMP